MTGGKAPHVTHFDGMPCPHPHPDHYRQPSICSNISDCMNPPSTQRSVASSSTSCYRQPKTCPSAYETHGNTPMVAKLQCPPDCVCHNAPPPNSPFFTIRTDSLPSTTSSILTNNHHPSPPSNGPSSYKHSLRHVPPPLDQIIPPGTGSTCEEQGVMVGPAIIISKPGDGMHPAHPPPLPSVVAPLACCTAPNAVISPNSIALDSGRDGETPISCPEEWRKAYRLRLLHSIFAPDSPESKAPSSSVERPRFICHVASGKEFGFPHDFKSADWDKAFEEQAWQTHKLAKEEERAQEKKNANDRRNRWRANFHSKLCSHWRFRLQCKDTNALKLVREGLSNAQMFSNALTVDQHVLSPQKSVNNSSATGVCNGRPPVDNTPKLMFSKATPPSAQRSPTQAPQQPPPKPPKVYISNPSIPAPPPTAKVLEKYAKTAEIMKENHHLSTNGTGNCPKKKHAVVRAFASLGKSLSHSANRNTVAPTSNSEIKSSNATKMTSGAGEPTPKTDGNPQASSMETPRSNVHSEITYREIEDFEERMKNGFPRPVFRRHKAR